MTEASSTPALEGGEIIKPEAKVSEGNGALNSTTVIDHTPDTAQMWSVLFGRRKEIEDQIQLAWVAAGLAGYEMVGGELGGDTPHFIVKKANNIVGG